MKLIYKILGLLMVILGLVGVVVPVLPTTPFLLLAAWFFGRSSEKLQHWLLTNRIFGRYISDYRSGRGIPMRMKVWTIALLWVTIGCSAIWAVDAIWLKIMLLCIAATVTVHILTMGRRQRVVVLVPTIDEAVHLKNSVICGVGMAATAATLTHIVTRRRRPRMVILAGIAGAYPDSGLQVGDCVVVNAETVGDIPVKYQITYECNLAAQISVLQRVASCTVNKPAADGAHHDAAIENMEGAVFFAICKAAGVPFLEVRAVSNMTTDQREQWRTEDATRALAIGLQRVIDEIEA